MESHPWHYQLPSLGTEEEFAALRRAFRESDYSTAGLCRHFNVEKLDQYKTPDRELLEAVPIETSRDALIRLFLDAADMDESALEQWMPADALAALWSLNLLARMANRPGRCYANFTIPPVGDLLVMMDRAIGPDGKTTPLPGDVVYPPVVENMMEFLAGLPRTACEALLDLGTGSGIAALQAAAYAKSCWGTDIIARPVRFAEFTRRLNGIENMRTAQGDLYEPVAGLTFDRIVTHPPYVPSKKNALIFRDGGEDGEQIIRRVVQDLPKHLRPGGRLYSLHMASDRKDEPYEQRIRKWLGPQECEFDVMVAVRGTYEPKEFLQRQVNIVKREPGDVDFWLQMWEANQTERLIYCWVVVRRMESPRKAFTVRVGAGKNYRPEHADWLLNWEAATSGANGLELLLGARPGLSPHCELLVLNRVRDGSFVPEEFQTRTSNPFEYGAKISGWVAELMAECDGAKTVRELFDRRVSEGVLPAGAEVAEFAGVVRLLVSNGVLQVGEYPIP